MSVVSYENRSISALTAPSFWHSINQPSSSLLTQDGVCGSMSSISFTTRSTAVARTSRRKGLRNRLRRIVSFRRRRERVSSEPPRRYEEEEEPERRRQENNSNHTRLMLRPASSEDPYHTYWVLPNLQRPLWMLGKSYSGRLLRLTNSKLYVEESIGCNRVLPLHIATALTYTEEDCRVLFRKICKVVRMLHSNQTAHRLLHLNNILCHPITGEVSLRGFQHAKVINGDAPSYDMRHACVNDWFAFSAPELDDARPHGLPVDIWSLGTCLYILLSGIPPFLGTGAKLVHDKQTARIAKFEITQPSQLVQHLLNNMLVQDPMLRYTIDQVLAHPWMSRHQSSPADLSIAQSIMGDWSMIKERRRTHRNSEALAAAADSLDVPSSHLAVRGGGSEEHQADEG